MFGRCTSYGGGFLSVEILGSGSDFSLDQKVQTVDAVGCEIVDICDGYLGVLDRIVLWDQEA